MNQMIVEFMKESGGYFRRRKYREIDYWQVVITHNRIQSPGCRGYSLQKIIEIYCRSRAVVMFTADAIFVKIGTFNIDVIGL